MVADQVVGVFPVKVWSYEAPEDKQDVFASRACPAFLTFTNAAYIVGVTVELPCHCKPQEVQSVVWFFRKHQGSSDETRALTDHHGNKLLDTSQVLHSSDLRSRFSIRLFSLLIFRAAPTDSGLYICGSAHQDFFYGYDLDLQEAPTLSFTRRFSLASSPGQCVIAVVFQASRVAGLLRSICWYICILDMTSQCGPNQTSQQPSKL
ncbi:hypothetical protein XENOCAPTIV_019687, partial [Xenoophorus captivus]